MTSIFNVIFIIITILWLAEFLIFPSLEKEEQSRKRSFSMILTSILTVIILNAVMVAFDVLLINSWVFQIVGLGTYLTGLILRYWSLVLLGKNFSRDVEVSSDQELISHGTYKYVRHPLYTGLFLLTVSVPLYFGNLVVFAGAVIIMGGAINIRINEEERFMEEVLGERYVAWKNKRNKMIPFTRKNQGVK